MAIRTSEWADQASLGYWPRRPDESICFFVDGYGRLSPNRQELNALLAQLGGAGVRVVVLRPSTRRRFARMAANLALADVIASAAR
jgi:hypothetical protein